MKIFICLFSFFILIFVPHRQAEGAERPEPKSVFLTPSGWKGMVVADDRSAAEWGTEILSRGGNAVDAAVATAFGMAVTRPHFAALGGGGFMIFCPASKSQEKSKCSVIDFREKAPIKAHKNMYLMDGKADTNQSQVGALASGIPGIPAGLATAIKLFGTMKLSNVLSKPIIWSQQGIRVSTHTETALQKSWKNFNLEARKIFSCQHKALQSCKAGDSLVQSDLAKTLSLISRNGADGFYKGVTAKAITKAMSRDGGIISEADLSSYEPKMRTPLIGKFNEYEIVTMPPPSSGGIVLLQLLKYFELAVQSGQAGDNSASFRNIHSMTHAMSLAFADRTVYLGDSDFYPVPTQQLLSDSYLNARWKSFHPTKMTLPESPGNPVMEPDQTTHLSVMDAYGNAVAMTLTVNGYFGSGYVPAGTGIVMNNQMDDFSLQPGVPNQFGLIGSEANSITPNKRPLSSMTPTIVRDHAGQARLALGAAGGPRIITSVFQTLLNRIHFGMSIFDAVAAPRIHHQWRPKSVFFETHRFVPATTEKLASLGYDLQAKEGLAVIHAVERDAQGKVLGAADPRGEGAAVAQ